MEILDHLTITKNQNAEINHHLFLLPESRTMVPQNNLVKSRLYQKYLSENLYFSALLCCHVYTLHNLSLLYIEAIDSK